MTDDEATPVVTPHQNGSESAAAVSLDAVATLVHAFSGMVMAMEARLTERIRDNATEAKERWQRWEADFAAYRDQTDRRITTLEGTVHEHHSAEERRQLAAEARVKPIRTTAGWLWDHWRDLVLLAIGLIALVTLVIDGIGHVVLGVPR